MRQDTADGVGDRRVDRAAGRVARAEHEVVDEQLRPPVEQLVERPFACVSVEAVLLLHPHPRKLAPLPGELVAEPRVLLLADQELLARGAPLLPRSDHVLNRLFDHLSAPSCRVFVTSALGGASVSSSVFKSERTRGQPPLISRRTVLCGAKPSWTTVSLQ